MSDSHEQLDQLGDLMTEYGLKEATWKKDGLSITLRKTIPAPVVASSVAVASGETAPVAEVEEYDAPAEPAAPKGTPITSPMTGIFYSAASPSTPPFVKVGDSVTAGQVVGLIEAMKVYSDIVSPLSGTVLSIAASNGQVVQPGEPLVFIG